MLSMKSEQHSLGQEFYLFWSKIYTSINEVQDISNQFDILHLKYYQARFLGILFLYSLFPKVKSQM